MSDSYLPQCFRHVGMASTARRGLKRVLTLTIRIYLCRNGLYSPSGIETVLPALRLPTYLESEWPLQPVGD